MILLINILIGDDFLALGSRLQTVANFVPQNSLIADIGTDHGYLPIELIKSGKCSRAIAGDVHEGPYFAAKRSIRDASLTAKIDLRLGSGLKILTLEDKVDIAVFAGMGGNLIKQLLSEAPDIVNSLQGLILQPQQGYSALRHYLFSINWHIIDEAIAKEDGRIYQIIYAIPGKAEMPNQLELEIGSILAHKRPPLFNEMIAEFITKTKRSLKSMEKSATAKQSEHYHDLQSYLQQLEDLL